MAAGKETSADLLENKIKAEIEMSEEQNSDVGSNDNDSNTLRLGGCNGTSKSLPEDSATEGLFGKVKHDDELSEASIREGIDTSEYSADFKLEHSNTCEIVNFGELEREFEDLENLHEVVKLDASSILTRDFLLSEKQNDAELHTSDINGYDKESVMEETDSFHAWATLNGKTFFNSEPLISSKKKISLIDKDEIWFDCLPDELIVKIFSYFSTQDLCRHVAPVCRRWRQFSMDRSLWKSIDFSGSPQISTLDMLWVIRKAPLLQKLNVSGRANITHAEVAIFTECCPALQEINFGFCDSLSNEMIKCLSENCPNLRKINIEGCSKLEHRSIRYLARCKKLTNLNFSHINLMDLSLKYLSENLSKIVSINLDGIAFLTDSGVISMVTKHQDYLRELELDGAEISDESILHLAKCKQLKHLSMSFSECLTDQALVYLQELEMLETLKLRKGSDFSIAGMTTFFQKGHLENLRSLNLSECTCIEDSVCLEMAKSCGKYLKELTLSWCWFITDHGLISIVDHCGNLESLDLLGIDKITGECLGRIPEEMPKLTFLDLRQCNQILDSLITDVILEKPDLKVYNYYGEEFVS